MIQYFKKEKFIMLISLIFISLCAGAQTTIQVMADQAEKLEARLTEEPVTIADRSVIFGDNLDISGGEGPFKYRWMKNGEIAGSGTTLEVLPFIRSDIYSLRITDANNCTALIIMPGDIEIPISVEDEKRISQISVYPVPASRLITIDPGDNQEILRVAFYSSRGDIILEKKIQGRSVIDISFPAGIYMIRITGIVTGMTEVRKIVVL
jgi:hypothetical protein